MPRKPTVAPRRDQIVARAEPAYLTPVAVQDRYSWSPSLLQRLLLVDPTFPKPIFISPRKRLFVAAELEAWMASRRDAPPLPPLRPAAVEVRKTRGGRNVPRR